jgi:toxin ParE1/3/4
MPAMGVAREYRDPKLEDVRMWRVAGFDSYLIFYRTTESGVEIIRVIHAKRDIEGLFGGQS